MGTCREDKVVPERDPWNWRCELKQLEDEMAQRLHARFWSTPYHGRALGARTPCGHMRHVGTCPLCQRAQLARWEAQLAEVSQERRHR